MSALNSLIYLTAIIANALLGLLVLLRGYKNRVSQVFNLFILSIIFWVATLYLFYSFQENFLVLLLGRLNFVAASLIAYWIFKFAQYFPRKTPLSSSLLVNRTVLVITGLLIFITLFTPLIDTNEIIEGASRTTIYGPLYLLFMLHFIGLALASIVIFFRKYQASSGSEKMQLRYLLMGTSLATAFGMTTNIFVPLLFNYYDIQNLGPLATVFLAGSVTYSIIKHRLMDIRLAIRAGILKLLMVGVLTAVFFSLAQIYLATLIEPTPKRLLFITTAAAAFLVFIYTPLDQVIRKLTDKILFQKEYSAQELLRALGKKMSESLDLSKLLAEIEKTLKQVMRVTYVKFTWQEEHLLLEQIRVNPQILVTDELKREISEEEKSPARARKEKIADKLSELEAGVLIPVVSKDEVSGLIILGEKKSGDAFTSSDLDTLETLKYQMGVAIENARLFSEVQNFNQKLTVEVNRATADLQVKNRNLSVLRKLDTIIINTLELSEMCQKIVDTISWEMGYVGGLIALLETENTNQYLRAHAVSNTPSFQKVLTKLPENLTDYKLSLSLDPSNYMIKAVKERSPQASDKLSDYYCPPLPLGLCQEMEKSLKIPHHVAYPLSSKGKALGVIVFGLTTPYNKLSKGELELLQAFMDQAGIAIENARLYKDLRRVNAELKEANEHLLDLDRMKDELVSVASHELRTPMTAIKSYLWMMLNKYQDEIRNPKLQQYLVRAYESSERMINLVNDMLSVSRIDTGRLQLEIKPTDLKNLIKSVVSDLASTATEEKVALTFNEPQGILPKALVDEDKIREVLMNLIGNALKYTPAGGKAWVDLRHEGKMLKVGVHDNGPGIPQEDLPRLFQKFGRLDSSFVTAAETGGTGLGLYISRGIVNLHHGKIWAKSKLGQGSHFYFTVSAAE